MANLSNTKDVELRVKTLAPLVNRMARHIAAGVPSSVEVGDLVQCGMMGLWDAAKRYEAQGAEFETYATHRIRYAMLDMLRDGDSLPRSVRRNLRQVESTISRLEQHYGRAPTETEIAKTMGMKLADYQRLLQEARGYQMLSYEDFTAEDDDSFLDRYAIDEQADPLHILEDQSLRETLVDAIDALPEREKTVMGLYYDKDLTLKQIGDVLGVTESRVSQIHTQAIARLRVAIKGGAN
ncbi:MAG TPA: RNA polymerase sigma factor FliA [Burkholderiales bacterium]|nr:RNA polymerase sigma factor FliA [Burkholderiales bacterium]